MYNSFIMFKNVGSKYNILKIIHRFPNMVFHMNQSNDLFTFFYTIYGI